MSALPDRFGLIIATNLRFAVDHLDDARTAHTRKNGRNAPFHLFMAAELTLLAVMASEGLSILRRDTQHQLDAMANSLPDENPTKPHFQKIATLTAFATTYRYPRPSGDPPPRMDADDFLAKAQAVERLLQFCLKWFGVEDVKVESTEPATRVKPPRAPGQHPASSTKP